jgi:prepilin-type processing-associated H-X9-DG protein
MSATPQPEQTPEIEAAHPNWIRRCVMIFAIAGIGLLLLGLIFPAVRHSPEAGRRAQCRNNLKQIGLALLNYHDTYGAFPPAFTVDAEGKPLHSWRTLILPFLDHTPEYNSLNLSRPWHAPVNSHLFEMVIPVYQCPTTQLRPTPLPHQHTTYLACAAPNGLFDQSESRSLSEVTDGTSQTLMVIEVPGDRSVPWWAPQDADETLIMLTNAGRDVKQGYHTGGAHWLLCDGSVRFVSDGVNAATRRALISIAGGDSVKDFDF